MVDKYTVMPDFYYAARAVIGPQQLGDEQVLKELGLLFGYPVQLWELMAGSAKLSSFARERQISHLPPIDYRWGVHMGRSSDQLLLLYILLAYGCQTLFASPTCTPWGNNARGWDEAKLKRERDGEGLALQFLAVLCFLQIVMGRSYMIENPKGSDIYEKSALRHLQHECLPHVRTTFDQCSYGATMDGGFVLKSTDIESG